MRDNVFLDTNIFIYALTQPKNRDNILAIASVESLNHQTYTIAFEIRQEYNISYWDSLVVASALESSCDLLYSEDMQDGLIIKDRLKIINPF